MHLDINGLPVQADGDANDQLQRVGMILTAQALGGKVPDAIFYPVVTNYRRLLRTPGIWARNVFGNPNTVPPDQLLSIYAFATACRWQLASDITWAMVKRLGFAQNTHTMEGKWRVIPDFMLIRALPLTLRNTWFNWLGDLVLVLLAWSINWPVFRDDSIVPLPRSLDDVDDNNLIMTLAVCHDVNPTAISKYACRLYAKSRPQNYGVTTLNSPNHIQGALDWYHRVESLGNPEIAQIWAPIVERVFYGRG